MASTDICQGRSDEDLQTRRPRRLTNRTERFAARIGTAPTIGTDSAPSWIPKLGL